MSDFRQYITGGLAGLILAGGTTFGVVNLRNSLPTNGEYRKRDLENIEYVIVHHTANEATVEENANYHVKINKWKGIGYHDVIEKGETHLCNMIDRTTYHAGKWNKNSIGIAVTGNYEEKKISDEDYNELIIQIASYERVCNIKEILGHQHIKATLCPGKNLLPIIEELNCLFGHTECE